MEVSGVTIPKGSPILLLLGAANRDRKRFPNADSFNADREDNQHSASAADSIIVSAHRWRGWKHNWRSRFCSAVW